jgi:hypothetical protein
MGAAHSISQQFGMHNNNEHDYDVMMAQLFPEDKLCCVNEIILTLTLTTHFKRSLENIAFILNVPPTLLYSEFCPLKLSGLTFCLKPCFLNESSFN